MNEIYKKNQLVIFPLIIEDLPEYQSLILKLLEKISAEYQIKFEDSLILDAFDENKILKYYNEHNSARLIIVDRILQEKDIGLQLVQEKLQPLDQTQIFLIYSVVSPKQSIEIDFLEDYNPRIVYISKESDSKDKKLISEDRRILNIEEGIKYAVEACIPNFDNDDFGLFRSKYDLDYFNSLVHEFEFTNYTLDQIKGLGLSFYHKFKTSQDLIYELYEASKSINKTGLLSNHVTITICGSLGRKEFRNGSDIELIQYYLPKSKILDDEYIEKIKQTCRLNWNITNSFLNGKIKLEGDELTVNSVLNDQATLKSKQQFINNSFVFDIDVSWLFEKVGTKYPEKYQNSRKLQLLTETVSIFNSKLLFAIKDKIIIDLIGHDNDFLLSAFLQNLFVTLNTDIFFNDVMYQVLIDQNFGKNDNDLKIFLFRVLYVVGIKLRLLGLLYTGEIKNIVYNVINIKSDSDIHISGLYEILSEPSYLKILNAFVSLKKEDKIYSKIKTNIPETIFITQKLISELDKPQTAMSHASLNDSIKLIDSLLTIWTSIQNAGFYPDITKSYSYESELAKLKNAVNRKTTTANMR